MWPLHGTHPRCSHHIPSCILPPFCLVWTSRNLLGTAVWESAEEIQGPFWRRCKSSHILVWGGKRKEKSGELSSAWPAITPGTFETFTPRSSSESAWRGTARHVVSPIRTREKIVLHVGNTGLRYGLLRNAALGARTRKANFRTPRRPINKRRIQLQTRRKIGPFFHKRPRGLFQHLSHECKP